MTVGNRSGVKKYTLGTPNRKRISKAAARGHKKGIVDQCFADPKVKTYVVHKVLQILQSEMKAMCSLQVDSILRDNTSDGIKVFNWNSFISELEKNAPLLYKILCTCTRTKQPRPNQAGTIGMCSAILMRHRCDKMNLVHKLVGLILYTGHSGKQVSTFFF